MQVRWVNTAFSTSPDLFGSHACRTAGTIRPSVAMVGVEDGVLGGYTQLQRSIVRVSFKH